MNLELLLLLACINGNQVSCITSANAYYKYSRLEEVGNKLEEDMRKNHKAVYFTGLAAIGIKDKKMIVPLVYNTSISAEVKKTEVIYMLNLNKGF